MDRNFSHSLSINSRNPLELHPQLFQTVKHLGSPIGPSLQVDHVDLVEAQQARFLFLQHIPQIIHPLHFLFQVHCTKKTDLAKIIPHIFFQRTVKFYSRPQIFTRMFRSDVEELVLLILKRVWRLQRLRNPTEEGVIQDIQLESNVLGRMGENNDVVVRALETQKLESTLTSEEQAVTCENRKKPQRDFMNENNSSPDILGVTVRSPETCSSPRSCQSTWWRTPSELREHPGSVCTVSGSILVPFCSTPEDQTITITRTFQCEKLTLRVETVKLLNLHQATQRQEHTHMFVHSSPII